MLRGLPTLTWLEIKIFVREPLGVIGTVIMPVVAFIVLGALLGDRTGSEPAAAASRFAAIDMPVLVALLIAFSAVQSLIAIVSIYREGGILKRLRATPLSPTTILTAHVVVKLTFTALTLGLMVLAGRRYDLVGPATPVFSFAAALLFCTFCILSLGFLIASLVPTARFAQPIGTLVLYPMLGISGLFFPVSALPAPLRVLAHLLPPTYAVSLLRGVWSGEGWAPHLGDAAALALMFAVLTAISSRVFRWE
jgi:ABC-2 type transport system permease protein